MAITTNLPSPGEGDELRSSPAGRMNVTPSRDKDTTFIQIMNDLSKGDQPSANDDLPKDDFGPVRGFQGESPVEILPSPTTNANLIRCDLKYTGWLYLSLVTLLSAFLIFIYGFELQDKYISTPISELDKTLRDIDPNPKTFGWIQRKQFMHLPLVANFSTCRAFSKLVTIDRSLRIRSLVHPYESCVKDETFKSCMLEIGPLQFSDSWFPVALIGFSVISCFVSAILFRCQNYCSCCHKLASLCISTFSSVNWALFLYAGIQKWYEMRPWTSHDTLYSDMRTGMHLMTPGVVSHTWEKMQRDKQCCGIFNSTDWKLTGDGSSLYPKSCCNYLEYDCSAIALPTIEHVWPNGCYTLEKTSLNVFIGLFLLLWFMKNLVDTLLSCVVHQLSFRPSLKQNDFKKLIGYTITTHGVLRYSGMTDRDKAATFFMFSSRNYKPEVVKSGSVLHFNLRDHDTGFKVGSVIVRGCSVLDDLRSSLVKVYQTGNGSFKIRLY